MKSFLLNVQTKEKFLDLLWVCYFSLWIDTSELEVLLDCPEHKDHHPEADNVLGHILKCLDATNSNDPVVLLSILFHDVGKAVTKEWNEEKQKYTYHGHDKAGLAIIDKIQERFHFDDRTVSIIKFCCEHHMRFHRLLEMKDSKVKKLVSHEYFEYLYEVAKADALCRGDLLVDEWNKIEERINLFR